jgi:subtilisin/minor extracellular protease Epr
MKILVAAFVASLVALQVLLVTLVFAFYSIKHLDFSVLVSNSEKSSIKRVIVDTVDDKQLKVLESEGCRVIHKITPSIALDCPSEVVSKFGLKEDLRVFAVDLSADKQIGADQVWALGFTGAGRLVAVLDTGVDYNHPELSDSIVKGRDFVNNDDDPMDDNGHGTHVAGIITANGILSGSKGVAPDAKVLAVKVLSASGGGYLSDVVAAIYYVVDGPDGIYGTGDEFNADAISMSLGTSPPYTYKGSNCDSVYPAMTNAISYARSRGVSVVAAAGNSGGAGISLPGCISGVITVGAVNSKDKVQTWSGKGLSLDLVAPGVSILSTWLNGQYATASGTSMATPMVSGTIALMKQKNPLLSVDEVYNKLITTAKDLGKVGFDTASGYGRVNALAAVNAS